VPKPFRIGIDRGGDHAVDLRRVSALPRSLSDIGKRRRRPTNAAERASSWPELAPFASVRRCDDAPAREIAGEGLPQIGPVFRKIKSNKPTIRDQLQIISLILAKKVKPIPRGRSHAG
jgi:hypothetical protein